MEGDVHDGVTADFIAVSPIESHECGSNLSLFGLARYTFLYTTNSVFNTISLFRFNIIAQSTIAYAI